MTRAESGVGDDPAERLDDELDRLVRGERRAPGPASSGFAPTIDRLFTLARAASASGTSINRPLAPTRKSPSPVQERRSVPPLPTRIRRFPMAATSTAAIVAIVLGITFSTFQSLENGPSHSSPLVQTDATAVATPEIDLVVAPPRALSQEDCNVEPRTREELIEILSTVPESTSERLGSQIPLSQGTFDELQQVLYAYQACLKYGSTFQWTALESPSALRNRVYQLGQVTPYTPSTLSEIVAGWEEIDAARAQVAEFAGSEPVWVLDPYKEDEAGVAATESTIQVPVSNRFLNGSAVDYGTLQVGVIFTVEEGVWRVERYPSVPRG